jgi:hypothetical protein
VAVVRNVVEEDVVLARVRIVSVFVVVQQLAYSLFLFMLLIAISDENVRSMPHKVCSQT